MTLLGQAATEPVQWWALVPTIVMFVFTVATAPVWPWSRGWGWSVAGMSAVALGVAGMFTLAWLTT